MPTDTFSEVMGEADRKVMTCIDEALNCYGESVKQVVYWNFEKMFNVTREKIPTQPEKFSDSLAKMFGGGVCIVEKAIVDHVASLSGLSDIVKCDLATALKKGRKHFQTAGQI